MMSLENAVKQLRTAFEKKDYALADELLDRIEARAGFRDPERYAEMKTALLIKARMASQRGDHEGALAIIGTLLAERPTDEEAHFFAGRFTHAIKSFDLAAQHYTASLLHGLKRPDVHLHLAEALHALAHDGFGYAPELPDVTRASYVHLALSHIALAETDGRTRERSLLLRARVAMDFGLPDQLTSALDEIAGLRGLARKRAQKNVLESLVRMGREEFVLKNRDKFAAVDPLVARLAARYDTRFLDVHTWSENTVTALLSLQGDPESELFPVRFLRPEIIYSDYLVIAVVQCTRVDATHWARAATEGLPSIYAGVATGYHAGSRTVTTNLVIRTEDALEVLQVLDLERGPTWASTIALLMKELRIAWFDEVAEAGNLRPALLGTARTIISHEPEPARRVLLITRSGVEIRGGGERFAADAAEVYVRAGYQVLIGDMSAQDGDTFGRVWRINDNISGVSLGENRRMFRRFVVDSQVRLVHTVSGFGHFVAEALRGLNVKLVYGVHFWREFLQLPSSNPSYFSVAPSMRRCPPDPAFQRILNEYDVVYANSEYTRDILKATFDVAVPMVPSCSTDEQFEILSRYDGHILLINCRPDKGWETFLGLATRMPGRRFVAYASQSSAFKAYADVVARRLLNVEVRDRTESLEDLYSGAAVALVPSFRFVETFGRVPVEAGRFGVPSIVANAGNLAYFGEEGVDVVPDRIDDWADALDRLLNDRAAYESAVAAARRLSSRYSRSVFVSSLERVLSAVHRPRRLVVCGAGIGNMLHTTPAIRWLARHHGHRMDVLVLGDHKGMAALLANDEYVNTVFSRVEQARTRNYEDAYITYSVATPTPRMFAKREHVARDVVGFNPALTEHEVEVNVRHVVHAAGGAATADDAAAYFLGGFSPMPLENVRVVLHAGSKGGNWANKRWPYFEDLAAQLAGEGMEVVSVGTVDEFVPGTLDRTGLSIEEMTDVVCSATIVVSNDSGVMNIANALGIPIVAVFGPTNPLTRGPRRSICRIVASSATCAPCERTKDDRLATGTCKCIGFVPVAKVLEALRGLLDEILREQQPSGVADRLGTTISVSERDAFHEMTGERRT